MTLCLVKDGSLGIGNGSLNLPTNTVLNVTMETESTVVLTSITSLSQFLEDLEMISKMVGNFDFKSL